MWWVCVTPAVEVCANDVTVFGKLDPAVEDVQPAGAFVVFPVTEW